MVNALIVAQLVSLETLRREHITPRHLLVFKSVLPDFVASYLTLILDLLTLLFLYLILLAHVLVDDVAIALDDIDAGARARYLTLVVYVLRRMITVLFDSLARQDALTEGHSDTFDLGEALLCVGRFHVRVGHEQIDMVERFISILIRQQSLKLNDGVRLLLHRPCQVGFVQHFELLLLHYDAILSIFNEEDFLENIDKSVVRDSLADSS